MKVALTFDAELPGRVHADPMAVLRILNALDERSVPATWFMQGRWCRYQPDYAREILNTEGCPHLIGSHGMFHAPMPMLSAQGMRDDIAAAEAEIVTATGVNPKPWFRAPNLAVNTEVESVVRDAGYWHVGADVLSMDWEPSTSVAELVERVVLGALNDGPVVLLHSWPRTTAEALPAIIDRLEGKVEFVTIEGL